MLMAKIDLVYIHLHHVMLRDIAIKILDNIQLNYFPLDSHVIDTVVHYIIIVIH